MRHRIHLVLTFILSATGLRAQSAEPELPFAVGEELVYRVRIGRFGTVGEGVLRVSGPEVLRARETYLLSFDFRSRIGPFTVEDRTRSWIDPDRLAALRFSKREKHPLSSHDEEVEIFPDERRWESRRGGAGASPTDAPLDELSFLYFIRTLPLASDAVYTLDRHFDPARNPVVVQVLRRERLAVPAGEFATIVVEMRVKDPGRFGGEGVLRMHLTDDERRIPLRIETAMPIVGAMVLSLESPVLSGSRLQKFPPSPHRDFHPVPTDGISGPA